MPTPRTTAIAGGLVSVLAVAGLIAAGYYFDYTGGGPSDVLSWLLWGALLLGLVLLGVAAAQAVSADIRARR
jgi:hypothetical protein